MTNANEKINSYWERWGVWVAVMLLSVCVYTFQEQKARVDRLEADVQQLYLEKASKEDLKEFETRMTKQVDGMKNDILSRIDFYFATQKQKASATQ